MDVSLSCLRNARPPVTSYAPCIWADTFSNSSSDEQVEKKYEEAIEELKQEARGLLMDAATPIKQMIFIDTLERLGLAYYFETEIEHKLQEIYDNNIGSDDYDLFATTLRFRLLRQHQHHISCNVLDNFVGKDGKFKETLSSDAEGLLSLYEAAHVRFRNEEILEEAARFTRHHLSCIESRLESPLKEKVKRALECPLHRDVPIFYTRFFIAIYESDDSMDDQLLKFAKFNFNFLQILYKKDLCELFRWWNKFDLKSKLPYARDRLVEAYIWGVGYHYEPQYSYVRKGVAKGIQISAIMDDTYDNYATLNEAQLLTEIIDRWTMDETHQVPNYLKIVFHFITSTYEDYERDATQQGKMFAASYFKETVQQFGKAENKELKWVRERHMPSFQEYAKNSEITSVLYLMFAPIILGLKSVTQETIDWVKSGPNLVLPTAMIGRYHNDIGSNERENKGGEILTAVNCYMKHYGVSKQETISKFEEAIEDAWKDVNEGWVTTTSVPKETTVQFLNYARMCNACYNRNNTDGYSDPQVFRAQIASLFVDPIKI